MNELNTKDRNAYVVTLLTIGGMWGMAEATLGFGLHTMARILPMPNTAGAIMFPLAFFFMVLAIRRTGYSSAAMAVAVVAAAIKASSLILPAVSFHFVRSPVLAILAEGAVVTVAAAAGSLRFFEDRIGADVPAHGGRVAEMISLSAVALFVAVAWRVLFLGVNIALGITGGIMSKPVGVLVQFVTIDSLWNAGIIAFLVTLFRAMWTRAVTPVRPLWTAAILVAAFATEWGANFVPF